MNSSLFNVYFEECGTKFIETAKFRKRFAKKKVCTLTQTVLLFLKTELMCKMFSSDACGSLSIFFHNEQGNMSARMITTYLTDTHLICLSPVLLCELFC